MHTDGLQETLSGTIRDAFFEARNKGETMYQASDVAAAHVIAVISPSMLRLRSEIEQLLVKWEEDRTTFPSSADWQARVAETMLRLCTQELRAVVQSTDRAVEPRLEAM